MPENDALKRYLDAGIAFTQMTRSKAEEWVQQWVSAGEVGRDQAQQRVDELVERSRKNTEQFLDVVRKEIANQLQALGIATKADLADLEKRMRAQGTAKPAAGSTATGTAKKATAKKATKKTTAKKAAATTKKAAGGSGA
jgi:polyhydroxyalkanoate synthesis regulator phasin